MLTGQFEPRSYGRQLLDVVARCQPMVPELAPSMAQSGDLESRLRHLLNAAPARTANHPLAKLCILVAGLSVAGLLAASQPAVPPPVDSDGTSTEATVQPSDDRPGVQLTEEPTPASPTITVRGTVGVIEPVTLKLTRGLVIRGVVRDAQGQPVAGAAVRAMNNGAPDLEASGITDDQGRFELGGLSPHVSTDLIVTSEAGNTRQLVEARPEHPWDQTRREDVVLILAAGITLTGRVLKDGQPVEGVTMELYRGSVANPNRHRMFTAAKTDAEGRYSVSDLAKGDRYRFNIIAPGNAIAPGWQHQSPYVQNIPDVDRDVIELPDAHLLTRNQSLRGVVVTPDGKPVPGITVSANLASGETLSRPSVGPPPWEETDEQGQFSLELLPDKPIRLMAFKANPAGGRLRFPVTLQPSLNQQDIRIVRDPRLDVEFEDLD